MSAYMCDKAHFDVMLSLVIEGPVNADMLPVGNVYTRPFRVVWNGEIVTVTRENASEIGQRLVDDNMASLNERYGGWEYEGWESSYEWTDPDIVLTLVEAYNTVAGYGYQSCETSDWYERFGYAFEQAVYRWMLGLFTGDRSAGWGWSQQEVDELRERQANRPRSIHSLMRGRTR